MVALLALDYKSSLIPHIKIIKYGSFKAMDILSWEQNLDYGNIIVISGF